MASNSPPCGAIVIRPKENVCFSVISSKADSHVVRQMNNIFTGTY